MDRTTWLVTADFKFGMGNSNERGTITLEVRAEDAAETHAIFVEQASHFRGLTITKVHSPKRKEAASAATMSAPKRFEEPNALEQIEMNEHPERFEYKEPDQ